EPAVDAPASVDPYQTGVDLTEGRPEVGELPVGSGGTRDGGKPVVAHEVVLGEGGQGRELLGTEAAHDVGGIAAGPLIARGEPAHGRDARPGYGELLVNVFELVPGIDGELSLVGRSVRHVV